jgi:hypothetical protein
MSRDAKLGLGIVFLLAVCCGGPLILSLLAAGAGLGALGAAWAGGGRPLLLLSGSMVVVVTAGWLLARRHASRADAHAACGAAAGATEAAAVSDQRPAGLPTAAREHGPVDGAGQRTAR